MIKFNGINHLAMATGDMDGTIRFWRDLLGMRLVAGIGEPGFRHYFFEISETDLIAFFEWDGVEPVAEKEHGEPVKGPFVFDHVAFGVDTVDDLWQLKAEVQAAGFEVSEMIDHGFIKSIYAYDPNGIPIEFCCNVPGRDVRKEPQMGDVAPSEVAQQGPDPQASKWPAPDGPLPQAERICYEGAGTELFQGVKDS